LRLQVATHTVARQRRRREMPNVRRYGNNEIWTERFMKRLTASIALAAAVLVISSSATAQSLDQHPRVKQALNLLRVWLDGQRAYDQIPGLSAAVVVDQNVLWAEGFGYADVERKTPATPDTIYSICSISKLFTSIAVMQLRD